MIGSYGAEFILVIFHSKLDNTVVNINIPKKKKFARNGLSSFTAKVRNINKATIKLIPMTKAINILLSSFIINFEVSPVVQLNR